MLKSRIRELRRKFGFVRPPDERLRLVTVLVDSAAPCLEPGPIRWGTVPEIAEIFERGAEESERDFVDRLAALAPIVKTEFAEQITVTIHAETHKPELPTPALDSYDPQAQPPA